MIVIFSDHGHHILSSFANILNSLAKPNLNWTPSSTSLCLSLGNGGSTSPVGMGRPSFPCTLASMPSHFLADYMQLIILSTSTIFPSLLNSLSRPYDMLQHSHPKSKNKKLILSKYLTWPQIFPSTPYPPSSFCPSSYHPLSQLTLTAQLRKALPAISIFTSSFAFIPLLTLVWHHSRTSPWTAPTK